MVFCLVKKCIWIALILVFALVSLYRDGPQEALEDWIETDEASHTIPQKIWQIDPWGFKFVNGNWVQSWVTKNIGYAYNLMTPSTAESFVRRTYRSEPRIVRVYQRLQSPSLKSDLLRFLVLLAEGGVYSDLDTDAIRGVDDWIPKMVRGRVRVIIGIEYDQLNSPRLAPGMFHPVQFCQWTVAGTKGHPVFRKMVDSMVQAIEDLARYYECAIEDLEPSEEDVLKTTGPVKWTETIIEYLSSVTDSQLDHRPFRGLQVPRLYGDVMILPIDGFGTGMPHSNSSDVNTAATMVRHNFRGTWRTDIQARQVQSMRSGSKWSIQGFDEAEEGE